MGHLLMVEKYRLVGIFIVRKFSIHLRIIIMFDITYQELRSRIQTVARRDGDIFIANIGASINNSIVLICMYRTGKFSELVFAAQCSKANFSFGYCTNYRKKNSMLNRDRVNMFQ